MKLQSSGVSTTLQKSERAGPDRLHPDRLDRLALEGRERLAHLARAFDQLGSAREPPVDLQGSLLAAGPVERAHAAALQPELEQLRERLAVLAADLALSDRRDHAGKPSAIVLVAGHRENGLRLRQRDLLRLAGERDSARLVGHSSS